MFRKRPRDEDGQSKELVTRGQTEPAPTTASLLRASLEVTAGPDKGQSHELTRMITLIGRDASCDIVFSEESISREHGQFEQHQNEWVFTNLSDNATWVNHKRAERLVLKDGDTVEIGAETRMKFRLREPEQVEVASAPRRRARVRGDETAEEELQEAPHPTVTTAAEGLLKRRKLMAVLGVYLAVIVAVIVIVKMKGSGGSGTATGPAGTWENYDEIERALDLTFPEYQYNLIMANRRLEEAKQFRQNWPYGDPGNLFRAIKAYQESYYYRGQTWQDFRDEREFVNAKTALRDAVWKLYRDAQLEEYNQRHNSARRCYIEIQRHVPDEKNPIFKHVQRRILALKRGS
ncbi:MAG TPA: FHA domain-containing protein [Phycisphaerae bacterium]|nr:FHA domain-containing protein [Phycisphaerae bacterium]